MAKNKTVKPLKEGVRKNNQEKPNPVVQKSDVAKPASAIPNNMNNQTINENDVYHLHWLLDRMRIIHGENENYDYMLKFKEIIEKLKK